LRFSENEVDNETEVNLLVDVLPEPVRGELRSSMRLAELNEVVLDLGYYPEIRWGAELEHKFDLGPVTRSQLDQLIERVGRFNTDNRSGIERTLHRISAIRNREGHIIGVTCRVGRSIVGTISHIREIVSGGKNILFLGPPGIGKTTKLRETARVLSVDMGRRVIVVDTSNEIGGDGDIPHPGIGYARRMQVSAPELQHQVMIEAVENHMPQVVIVDEIGTAAEAAAARTIAERGVQLVATAHGYTLENLVKNPMLSDLIGGIQSVILGDDEAKLRGTQKTVLERRNAPTFDVIIEIREKELVAVYRDTRAAVDSLLKGERAIPDLRRQGVVSGGAEPVPLTDAESAAIAVAQERIRWVLEDGDIKECDPVSDELRRLQHSVASAAGLNSVDIGPEPYRRVRIYPKVQG